MNMLLGSLANFSERDPTSSTEAPKHLLFCMLRASLDLQAAKPGASCMQCMLPCQRKRSCEHPCPLPCHPQECPECEEEVRLPCHCTRSTISLECSELQQVIYLSQCFLS